MRRATRRRERRRIVATLCLTIALALAACDRALPPAGPVPLRDDAHLRAFLAGASAWELRGVDGVRQYWSFPASDRFRAWIVPSDTSPTLSEVLGLKVIPDDATLISGRWNASKDTLLLLDVRTDTGVGLGNHSMTLRWIDGKLRIGIGRHPYMRARDPAP